MKKLRGYKNEPPVYNKNNKTLPNFKGYNDTKRYSRSIPPTHPSNSNNLDIPTTKCKYCKRKIAYDAPWTFYHKKPYHIKCFHKEETKNEKTIPPWKRLHKLY